MNRLKRIGEIHDSAPDVARPALSVITSIFSELLRLAIILRLASKRNYKYKDARTCVDAEIEELRREDANTSEGGK